MKRTYNGISHNLRNLVYERDSYTCVLCERPADDCHHVIPKSKGGRDVVVNLVSICRYHHALVHREITKVREGALTSETARVAVLSYIETCYGTNNDFP